MVPQPVPVPYMLDPMGYPIPLMHHSNSPYAHGGPMGVPPLSMPMLNLNQITSPRGIPGEFPYNIPPQFAISEEPNLFIFHLPPDMNDAGLHSLFTEFGPIDSVKVMVDKNTGESKGYGFVQFINHSDAERALNTMNGRSIGCKRLSVSYKTPSPRNSPRGERSPRTALHNTHSQFAGAPCSPRSFFVTVPSPR